MSLSERAIEAVILLEMENERLRRQIAVQDDNALIRAFWSCGDSSIIAYAVMRAHLNRNERNVLHLILDECMSQESATEKCGVSTRSVQNWWHTGTGKILRLAWVRSYAADLVRRGNGY